ncbi:hypothetical protein KY284_034825 [Solanum tuberosum]|nr:hypothetical protein KY284_034825 [Solanum tuberosum]
MRFVLMLLNTYITLFLVGREAKYIESRGTSTLIVREENEFSDTVQDFEVPIIPKIESLSMITTEPIEQIQDFEVAVIPKIESSSVITEPIEKIQDFEVPVIPKIESLSVITTEPIEKVEEKAEKIKKMLQFKRRNRVSQAVPPEELKKKIQELGVSISQVSLVIEKPLYSTDLSEKHMRLSIPVKQVVNPDEFLNAQEKEILDTRDSCNRMSKIKFNLIEPSLEVCNIYLAKWSMNSSSSYVLLNDWMSVHQRNGLKADAASNEFYGQVSLVPDNQVQVLPCTIVSEFVLLSLTEALSSLTVAARILANIIVMGSAILARSFVQAYRQALANASRNGVAQEAVQNMKRASKTMTDVEARQILGVTENASWEEIMQRYDNLFERNAKNGSFYLQSKVHRAKECLEAIHQPKEPEEK